MLRQPVLFIVLPILAVGIPFAIGLASMTTREPAFRAIAMVYFVWNAWHFASQNYGICALSGGSVRQRTAAFALTVVCILGFPLLLGHILWVVIADMGVSLMHWIMDIRLSAFAARRWLLFTVIALGIGTSGFLFKTVTNDPRFCGAMMACTAAWS